MIFIENKDFKNFFIFSMNDNIYIKCRYINKNTSIKIMVNLLNIR